MRFGTIKHCTCTEDESSRRAELGQRRGGSVNKRTAGQILPSNRCPTTEMDFISESQTIPDHFSDPDSQTRGSWPTQSGQP
ncbi:hypothetical protein AOLI_G00087930 [Acnodon oligacanthus]